MIKITIYNEYVHEQEYEGIRKIYPQGIHGCLKSIFPENQYLVKTATFEEPEHGLTEKVLDDTDVLIYWSHAKQEDFSDQAAQRIRDKVLGGMGFIGLHSAHFSKPMKLLLGTSMSLKWQNNHSEKLWCTCPSHPIAQGLPQYFELEKEEMYGEFFDIPKPDDVIYTASFSGGQVFRAACTWTRGLGKIFYLQPGHEEYPNYYNENIRKLIKNGADWCYNPNRQKNPLDCIEVK